MGTFLERSLLCQTLLNHDFILQLLYSFLFGKDIVCAASSEACCSFCLNSQTMVKQQFLQLKSSTRTILATTATTMDLPIAIQSPITPSQQGANRVDIISAESVPLVPSSSGFGVGRAHSIEGLNSIVSSTLGAFKEFFGDHCTFCLLLGRNDVHNHSLLSCPHFNYRSTNCFKCNSSSHFASVCPWMTQGKLLRGDNAVCYKCWLPLADRSIHPRYNTCQWETNFTVSLKTVFFHTVHTDDGVLTPFLPQMMTLHHLVEFFLDCNHTVLPNFVWLLLSVFENMDNPNFDKSTALSHLTTSLPVPSRPLAVRPAPTPTISNQVIEETNASLAAKRATPTTPVSTPAQTARKKARRIEMFSEND
jgi:hypothetical protein